jgi:O-succinylbenzoate synthase
MRERGPPGPVATRPRIHLAPTTLMTPMHVDLVELRLLRMPLVRPFETSFGRVDGREFIVVTVHADGAEGWGECVADVDPFYSAETTVTAWHVLESYLVPALLATPLAHPRDAWGAFAHVRGHRMAKAALEMALWDLHARQLGVPLSRVLGGTRTEIASGVSIGIQDSLDTLCARVDEELAAGYRRVKVKIKPGWDVHVVGRLRERFGGIALMADANAAYRLADRDRLAALDAFDLMMIEQPLDEEDLHEHAELASALRTPICLDESIVSPGRAVEALRLGACRIVNIKPGRIGGFAESIRVHDVCQAGGVPVWHGGMLESGIGRAANIHLASLAGFSLPGDIAASRRYFAPDLIEPGVEVRPDGTIAVPRAPGLGVEIIGERVERAAVRRVSFRR